ncbi:MAG: polyprenyl synthetase family protein, partial [Candidatus Omnitrophica bacterium]|nr:polyprenyl synthetase family protein [Candidatus Omnitrophota bacterium]
DDLPAMDNAETRRGQPSCHRRFGEAAAILVGDALLTRAFEVLSADGMPNTLAILRTLGQAGGTAGLIGGQVLDLECGMRNGECGIKELEEVARRKTAALITAAVVTGGLSAGASAQDLTRLRRYGERVGLAFQLMDDLHDRDGLAGLRGEAAVRRQAARLLEHAAQELVPFGRRAWLLRELADWLSRT